MTAILRVTDGRMLGGVCAGLARSMGWDATIVRALISLLTVLTAGLGALIYLLAWVLLPRE